MDLGDDLSTRADALTDGLVADLERLTAIPPIAFPGFPPEPVREAHDLLVDLLRGAGVEQVERLDLPDSAPVVVAEVPPPAPGAPTVLLYGHYDVQPPGDDALWRSPPFEPTPVEGGLRARGIADDKAGIIVHLGVLRACGGRPPVGLKIVLEGQEEYGNAFDAYPPTDPERFACDAMVIAEWTGATYTEDEFRSLAGVQEGMPLIGSGGLGECLWSGPAITVIGIDASSVDHAASAVVPYARAKLNLRFHPEQDPREARDLLVTHLESLRPFGIPLTVTPGDTGPGFEPATDGPAYRAATPNERVLFSELRSAVIAEAAFLREYARTYGDTATHADSAGGAA